MKRLVLLFIPLFCMSCSSWSKQDYIRHGLMTGLMVVDMKQTHNIVSDNNYYEINPVMGKNPSHGAVNMYFLSSWIMKTWWADQLSSKPSTGNGEYCFMSSGREDWQLMNIRLSASMVGNNLEIGLGVKW